MTVEAQELRDEAWANRRCHRRVRDEARDALAVVAFSAAASTALVLAFVLLASLAG